MTFEKHWFRILLFKQRKSSDSFIYLIHTLIMPWGIDHMDCLSRYIQNIYEQLRNLGMLLSTNFQKDIWRNLKVFTIGQILMAQNENWTLNLYCQIKGTIRNCVKMQARLFWELTQYHRNVYLQIGTTVVLCSELIYPVKFLNVWVSRNFRRFEICSYSFKVFGSKISQMKEHRF